MLVVKPEMLAAGERLAKLPPEQIAFFVQRMQDKIDAMKRQLEEPIALVGLACRFPGGSNTPERFWDMLRAGTDAISVVPEDRWNVDAYFSANPDDAGKMYSRWGGFIDDVGHFDADLFRITPREAASMDPQHRLLLEVSYEAMESAGLAPRAMEGSRTGVFVGAMTHDFEDYFSVAQADSLRILGTLLNGASGRISYAFGLRGPSIALDAACSSSLVTMHLACQSLRERSCDVALSGGVNLILSPALYVYMSRARTLSPRGRCRTFDAGADGYVRGEGCGMVVLKRLSDAVADGDSIRAVLLSSHVNQNGRGSNWTAPSAAAQTELLRDTLSRSGLHATDIDYLEAHGTGTVLGDPNEIEAAGQVYGQGRSVQNRLAVGSVKTNIGHLEAAAGVAGLLKVVLALEHAEIPPHRNLTQINPHINLESISAVFPTRPLPWHSSAGRRRRAAVSSFGLSGTNSHVIVEEAPAHTRAARPARSQYLLLLSAQSQVALQTRVHQLCERLSMPPIPAVDDLCFTANVGRDHFAWRLCVCGPDLGSLGAQLAQYDSPEGVQRATRIPAAGHARGVLYRFDAAAVYSPRAVLELYETAPAFKAALDLCAELLKPLSDVDLIAQATTGAASVDADIREPVAFAVAYSLATQWQAWDVKPTLVAGTGLGDWVAACVSGTLSLVDALNLAILRGRVLKAQYVGQAQQERSSRAALHAYAAQIQYAASTIPWRGEATGLVAMGQSIDASYWLKLLDGHPPAAIVEDGYLSVNITLTTDTSEGAWSTINEVLAPLYLAGHTMHWATIFRGAGQRIALPTYPMQRQRFWPKLMANTFYQAEPGALAEETQSGAKDKHPAVSLEDFIRHATGTVLGLPSAPQLGPDDRFDALGVDSMMAVDLRNSLMRGLGCDLPVSVLLQFPTLGALTNHLAKLGVPLGTAPSVHQSDELLHRVEKIVRHAAARVLGYDEDLTIRGSTDLSTLGFDSAMVDDLRAELTTILNLTVPQMNVQNNQTVDAWVQHVAGLQGL